MNVTESENCTFCNSTDYVVIYEVPIGIIVLLSVLYGSISVVAVAGNFMVIWIVASSKSMQNVTNGFICNLALADIVIGFFVIPFEFQAALLQRWNLPEFMCAFCPFIHVLSVNVSVFTLTAIAVDRHRAILYPLSQKISKATAKIIITTIWLVSGLIAAPMAIALRVGLVEDAPGHQKPFCYNVHLEDFVMVVYRLILVILQYIIPLSIITWSYARMAHTLWGNKTPGNAQDARDATLLKNKQRVIKMLVMVVALFGICWLPLQVYNLLQGFFPQINEYKYINIIWFCFDWLAMSNSCYNPFLYNYYNEKFCQEFRFRLQICTYGNYPGFKRNKSDRDTFGLNLRMSRYYDAKTRSTTPFKSVPRTSASVITLSRSISITNIDCSEIKHS